MKTFRPTPYCEQRRMAHIQTAGWSNPFYERGATHLVFGTAICEGCVEWEYSDRMWERDYKKTKAAYATARQAGNPEGSADFYQAYLSAYYTTPIHLFGVRAGVNVASGHPYHIFGFIQIDEEE